LVSKRVQGVLDNFEGIVFDLCPPQILVYVGQFWETKHFRNLNHGSKKQMESKDQLLRPFQTTWVD